MADAVIAPRTHHYARFTDRETGQTVDVPGSSKGQLERYMERKFVFAINDEEERYYNTANIWSWQHWTLTDVPKEGEA